MIDVLSSLTPGALSTLQGLLVSSVAILALFVGFCVLLGFPKLRRSGRHSKVVRGLDEVVGGREIYLPASPARGKVDQLRTPELLELQARKSG